jgi:dipeptidyl aminopeptidase/acylaminoacyl peptidase
MTSAYGGIRWGTGMVRQFQYEKTQSRIGAPLFGRALQFIENSPVFWAERVRTPYLSIHNDEDDAVPWYQGIEFFTALRRLGKEAYMFNFNGEKHGLRERENQKYWTVFQDEFFDHYLLGKPRPEWMDKPIPYLERGKRDVKSLYSPELKKAEKK